MNKISVVGDYVSLKEGDDLINLTLSDKLDIFDVVKINIEVIGSTDIEINYSESSDTKLEITYNVLENINLNILEINESSNIKIANNFYIKENSVVNINKFYDTFSAREMDLVSLDGVNAKVNYSLKSISKKEQKYDVFVYHNYDKTESNIINKGANINEGSITFNLTGIVPKGIKGCILNQSSRIITFNDKKCTINPKLLIDEQDVIANHSALIGTFDEETLFYLMSRGISKENAIKLLVKGFLLDEESDKINKIIDKYWRFYE